MHDLNELYCSLLGACMPIQLIIDYNAETGGCELIKQGTSSNSVHFSLVDLDVTPC